MRPGSLFLILGGLLAWFVSFRLKMKQWEDQPGRKAGDRPDWTSLS